MNKIGFLGAFDKTNLILAVSKVLIESGKRVLIVDGTIMQRCRYIIPKVGSGDSYITEFEKIDVAVGFIDLAEIVTYLQVDELPYDYVIVDTDSKEAFYSFTLTDSYKNFFVTSFDSYYLKRGVEILKQISEPIEIVKVIYTIKHTNQEMNYFYHITQGINTKWNKEEVFFILNAEDQAAEIENQQVEKVRFKGTTQTYRDSVQYMTAITGENDDLGDLRRTMKKLERGV